MESLNSRGISLGPLDSLRHSEMGYGLGTGWGVALGL